MMASDAIRRWAVQMYEQGLGPVEIATIVGFSSRSIHRWVKQAPPPPAAKSETAWMDAGLCLQTDPNLFHPLHGQSHRPAKRVCADCPVIEQCQDYALTDLDLQGVWGGTSHRERLILAGKRRA